MSLRDELIAQADRLDEQRPGGVSSKLMREAADQIFLLRETQMALGHDAERVRAALRDATARIVELAKARDAARTRYDLALVELLKLGNYL